MVNKAINLCQLAVRAGKFVRGDSLIGAIQSGKARVVLYSDACGANRLKKITDKCASFGVPCYAVEAAQFDKIGDKAGLALGITDKGFAQAIIKALTPEN